jgi:DNA-binding response OmpR family regulator
MTTNTRLLIVDDNEYNLDFYDALLQGRGYTIIKARDGIEALDRFEKCPPSLVIVDIMMPRLNGLDFCARLRRTPQGHNVPILVITGLDDAADRQNALKSGANDFLAKPFQSAEFVKRIRALLDKHKS